MIELQRPAGRPGRAYYIGLAHAGLRMPIGTDLILHEHADPGEIVLDGRRLGQVSEEAACRYGTPLAVPLMDLRLEKADLLHRFGVSEADVDTFHFDVIPSEDDLARVAASIDAAFPARSQAHFDSIRYIAGETKLVPVGMAIGPFSLMTKLMADPIVPIAMAGMGVTGAEDPGVLMAERCLALAEWTVHRSLRSRGPRRRPRDYRLRAHRERGVSFAEADRERLRYLRAFRDATGLAGRGGAGFRGCGSHLP